ncbi:hypothetical protein P6709_10195 [Jeotgalibacillus sp. ET6]|uniref:hypothetical protein n=1 Tax=Jeotgalibacillus sp. ET6 TaxID=3037260 RepID=UPI0024188D05|nr:hypothetical protein [Jeotgalibacillus sp. ET6]MDG5472123.1 hypothetical protein [Jeotgalibacillus sp. ET6]
MKDNKRKPKEKLIITCVWLFSFVYMLGYLYNQPVFPVTEGLKAVFEPIYYDMFGGS